MAIWYISPRFVIFLPVLVCCTKTSENHGLDALMREDMRQSEMAFWFMSGASVQLLSRLFVLYKELHSKY
jgi:hypothetical protein